MSKFDELKKLAEAATPGPWIYQEDSDAYTHIVRPASNVNRIVASGCQTSAETGEPTGRFIAAANPAAVLELLAIQAKLVAALGRIYKNECEVFDEETNGMVICCMDTDDMMEVARAALAAAGAQP